LKNATKFQPLLQRTTTNALIICKRIYSFALAANLKAAKFATFQLKI